MTHPDRRQALGAFLRIHRERLPAPVGANGRRRTPGLRREEVAEAARVSATWITWLEQGRDVSASPHALARLAQALALGPAERAYLFDLAGRRDPAAPEPPSDTLPAPVLGLPGRLTIPAYLLDQTWTALAWNAAAAALFTGWLDGDHDRNLLRFIFLSPRAPQLIDDWPDRARRVVAECRADSTRRLRDGALQAVIEDLCLRSSVFADLWREQAVLSREGGERRFRHPPRRFYQSTLALASHPDIRLVTLTPLDD